MVNLFCCDVTPLKKQKIDDQYGHADADGAVRNVEYRPAVHDEIRKVEIEKIYDPADQKPVGQVSEGSSQHHRQSDPGGWGSFFHPVQIVQQKNDRADSENGQEHPAAEGHSESYTVILHVGQSEEFFTHHRYGLM